MNKEDLSKELRDRFKSDHPETIGEKDQAFDDSNYIDWLEAEFEKLRACMNYHFIEGDDDLDRNLRIKHLIDHCEKFGYDHG